MWEREGKQYVTNIQEAFRRYMEYENEARDAEQENGV
jgi:hypothetical protein